MDEDEPVVLSCNDLNRSEDSPELTLDPDSVRAWTSQDPGLSGPEQSRDHVLQINEIESTSFSLIKNKKIKKWSFYDEHKLCSFECHTDVKDDKIIQQKFYLNNMCVDVKELPSLNIINHITKLETILKEHHEFIRDVNKYLNELSFNHSLKYGWKRNDLSFSLTVYKYKDIECILHFKQKEYILNKEEILLFLQNHYSCTIECQDSIITHFSNLNLNENQHNNIQDVNDVNELVHSVHNLNLIESQSVVTFKENEKSKKNISCNKKKKSNYDFLFINYPKWKRIEYQSCKKYDIEEIEFNKYNHHEEEDIHVN